jgi:tetratricopeptide (TPR) repeat protein
VLDKSIKVSRDFNRDFMFHYNHVLHVSLMHRKEAALRVGGFDENVKVLIEWSLNRRLCFIYDFIHVPVVTGEYYMPVFKSDRISVVQRKDKNSYRHNIRKIKANRPSKPWSKVESVDFIYPVTHWDSSVKVKVGQIVEQIDHPVGIVLVNNQPGTTEDECWQALGEIGELQNITIVSTPKSLSDLQAFRYGARRSTAKYVFLFTKNTQLAKVPKRILFGVDFLKTTPHEGVKWDLPEEKGTSFDLLIDRKIFLKRSDPNKKPQPVDVRTVPIIVPGSFQFDMMYAEVKRRHSKGHHESAFNILRQALDIESGAPAMQYLIYLYFKICLALKKYDLVEDELRGLIRRGYEPDNWIRLGQVLQLKKKYPEAIEAFKRGLEHYDLNESDLDSPVFPFNFPQELSSFTALMGLAECHNEIGDKETSFRMYHLASRLRANSHRPFLGFAKHYLAANELDRAEAALSKLGERNGGSDPETHRVLGKFCERRGNYELAFDCYLKAFECAKTDERNIDPLYFAADRLGRWAEVKPLLETFLENSSDHVPAMARLSSVYFRLGEYDNAARLTERGLALDASNVVLKGIARKTAKAIEESPPAPFQEREERFDLNISLPSAMTGFSTPTAK